MLSLAPSKNASKRIPTSSKRPSTFQGENPLYNVWICHIARFTLMKTSLLATESRAISRLSASFIAFFVLASTLTLQADEVVVQANFADGNSESAPNGFPGEAGEGWLDSWRVTQPDNADQLFNLKVLQDEPLEGQTHYLHVEPVEPHGFITFARSLDRSVLDTAKPHTVHFALRIDAFDPIDGEFRFKISAQQKGVIEIPKSFWYVCSQLGFWYTVGKTENGEPRYWKSSMPLVLGTTYSFTVTVDPEAKTYEVTINDGTKEVGSPVMLSQAENARDGADEYSFQGAVHGPKFVPFAWSFGGVEVRGVK